MTEKEIIDIVLPVAGNYTQVKAFIDSVIHNTFNPFRLIIVDNGITEPELLSYLTELKKNNENIRLVAKGVTSGYAVSLNKGLEVSKSELVAILNPAVIVSKNWLNKLKDGLLSNENISMIAPMCNNRFIPNIDIRFNPQADTMAQLEEYNNFLENNDKPAVMEVPYILGYCMLIKKELLEKCGGFDSIFGTSMYFADFDLCFRAVRKGFKAFVSNKTVIYRDNSDLDEIRHPEVKLPVNYSLFSKKWNRHDYFKYLPANMFPNEVEELQQVDQDGFYYNDKLKNKHKKYLLINPSIVDTKYAWRFSYFNPQPGILRVANHLINQGHKINYYDFEPYNPQVATKRTTLKAKEELFEIGKPVADFMEYIEKLKDQDIDEIMISVTITYHYPHLPKLISKIREVFGDTKITVGGIYATLCPEEIRNMGVEVHVGPYETADNLRPLMEISTERTHAVMRVVKGCPRTCSYCVVPGLEGRKLTHYDKESIIKHFQEYFALGYTNYLFWDSNLLFGRDNLYVLLDYLVDNGYNESVTLDFAYGLEFALIDDIFIQKISQFLLYNKLYVPLESSEHELYKERFHRPNSHLGVITKTVQKLQQANFTHMNFYAMTGLPNQTLDQVLKTLIFGWRLGLRPSIMLYCPIPGTEEFPKYLELYKDKESWELNPHLYPCESEEMTSEMMLIIDSFSQYYLGYSAEEGFFLHRMIYEKNESGDHSERLSKIHFNDQNHVMTRLKELLQEEDVRSEEVDDRTLRFSHAINM